MQSLQGILQINKDSISPPQSLPGKEHFLTNYFERCMVRNARCIIERKNLLAIIKAIEDYSL